MGRKLSSRKYTVINTLIIIQSPSRAETSEQSHRGTCQAPVRLDAERCKQNQYIHLFLDKGCFN